MQIKRVTLPASETLGADLGNRAHLSYLSEFKTCMNTQYCRSLVWFRRDLRLHDHTALSHALANSAQVFCVFVFDQDILQDLPRQDRRVEFILQSVQQLDSALAEVGGQLLVRHARAYEEIPRLAQQLQVDAVFFNHDYEPAAISRDAQVVQALHAAGRASHSFKDQVIFEKNEILSASGSSFSVFTPYKNAWLKRFVAQGQAEGLPCYQFQAANGQLCRQAEETIPSLADLGFQASNLSNLKLPCGMQGAQQLFDDFAARIGDYGQKRDFPARKGPSYLSTHLRFGTISIRTLVRAAWQASQQAMQAQGAQVWLSELIWREFYQMILFHAPHVVTRSFKPAYDAIVWHTGAQAQTWFAAWCAGQTGYPLVDAAMLQLNQTGYMHNRLRMVTACFLIKDLGIDWRWGEAYFAQHLNDFDLAANNGGWQWAACSGCDAQPWFRIFNPITQSEKFDADGQFIKRYLPQLADLSSKDIHAPWRASPLSLQAAGVRLGSGTDANYQMPLIEHALARANTLARYAVVKKAKADGEEDE